MNHDDGSIASATVVPAEAANTVAAPKSPARWAATFWGPPLLVGAAAALLLPASWGETFRLLSAWNLVLLIALARALSVIVRSDAARSRAFARATDPGNVGLLLISVLVSVASVLGAVFALADPNPADSAPHAVFTVAQVVFAIFGGWTLMQTAFTFHYARLYYSRVGDGLDLRFPDGVDPDDLDFAYFAFGIGVAFQVSDVEVTTRAMRRAVLVHSVLSFAFNAAILALMVNLLAGRI
jgi:uncharacterized membrane protein